MSKKTRKHIWPVSLVMALAIIVTVSGFIVLATNPGGVQAQEDCSALSPDERAQFEALGGECQDDTSGPPPPPSVPTTPVPTTPVPSTPSPAGPSGSSTPSGGSATTSDINIVAPGMVQNLSVQAYDDGIEQEELEVTWEPPTDGGYVESYRIDISTDKEGKRWFSFITDHGSNDLRWVHKDLQAGDIRHFRVFAFSHDDEVTIYGPGSEASGTTAASWVPNRPEDLMADMHDVKSSNFNIDMNGDGDANDTVKGVKEIDHLIDFNDDGDFDDSGSFDETNDDLGWPGSTQTTIRLSWEPPENPPGAPVTLYEIEYSGDGDRWYKLADVPPTTQPDGRVHYHDVGLRSDTERQYRVYAHNAVGPSMVSDGDTGKTAISRAPHAIYRPVIGLSPASTDVHLKWSVPDDPPGDPVSHYRVQARESDTDPVTPDNQPGAWLNLHGGTTIDRTDVYNFGGDDLTRARVGYPSPVVIPENANALVLIDVRIVAINRVNTDSASSDIDLATNLETSGWVRIEGVPVGHEDAPKRADTPTVDKDQDRHDGRSGLNVIWDEAEFIEGEGPSTDVPGPTDFDQKVSYIVVINSQERAAILHGPLDLDDSTVSALDGGGNVNKPGYDDDQLAAGITRTYRLYALNSDVGANVSVRPTLAGDASVRSFPSGSTNGSTAAPLLPGQPLNLMISGDGHTEIKLIWARPETDDADNKCVDSDPTATEDDGSECPPNSAGSVIKGYQIERSETGTSGWTTIAELAKTRNSPTMFQYLDTKLQPDKRYFYRVSAVNARGTGLPTAPESAKTHDPGEPTPPGGLVAQAEGTSTIKLCWYESNVVDPLTGAAVLDEGLPVLGYQISYVGDDGNEVILVEDTGSRDTIYTNRGLAPETTRTYRVRSQTLGGVGTAFAEATAMTEASPPSTAPSGALTEPTNIMAMSDAAGELSMTWEGAANADLYVLIAVDLAPISWETAVITDGAARSGTVTGLTSGKRYLGIVVATKGTGADTEVLYETAAIVTVE